MSRYFEEEKSKDIGLPPGTMLKTLAEDVKPLSISLFSYDGEKLNELTDIKLEELLSYKAKAGITWINIDGISDTEALLRIGGRYELHPLILEDITNTSQRPKLEDYDNYFFVVIKMLYFDDVKRETDYEQVSFIIGGDFVISFQEKQGDIFDPIRERLRQNKGRLRKMGADYLAYSLIDAVVDHYFLILEKIGEKIEDLEDELLDEPDTKTLKRLHDLKQEVIFLRKSIWPLREVISGFQRIESSLVKKSTQVYLRDLYDHTIQVIDSVETYRDILSGMLDIYLSSVSNRMNEVMKVLTIIATIFIPLTFIAGIYGMNFKYMPELSIKWAYFIVLGVMGFVAAIMLLFFRKKNWL